MAESNRREKAVLLKCHACGRSWPVNHKACPVDGSPLGGSKKTPSPRNANARRDRHPEQTWPRSTEELPQRDPHKETVSFNDIELDMAGLPPPSSDLAPGVTVGEYVIDGKVGSGAMGVVYGATHPVIGKKAAVKVMRPFLSKSPEAVHRFVQEAKTIGQLGHPNIVDAFSFGTLPDGCCYFMMEWLRGESLGSRFRRGPMELIEAVDMLSQVCQGLEAAHDRGIVHRDLKPDNIYLNDVSGSRSLVKLLDFGIAKLTEGNRGVHLTKTGVLVGTPAYMSPEQARGEAVDFRADIYSLGVVAFEAFLGRPPFTAENKLDIVLMHVKQAPPLPSSIWPGIPASLDRILLRMLAKDPNHRPTLQEVRQVLSDFGASLTPATPRPEMQTPPPTPSPLAYVSTVYGDKSGASSGALSPEVVASGRSRSYRRRGLIAGAALMCVVGALAFALVSRVDDDEPPRMRTVPPTRMAATLPESAPSTYVQPLPRVVSQPEAGGMIVVVVEGPKADIVIDRELKARQTRKARIEVDQGEHEVVVTAPGHKTWRQMVTVADSPVDRYVTLERVIEEPEEEVAQAPARGRGRTWQKTIKPLRKPTRVILDEPEEPIDDEPAPRSQPDRRSRDDDDGTMEPWQNNSTTARRTR